MMVDRIVIGSDACDPIRGMSLHRPGVPAPAASSSTCSTGRYLVELDGDTFTRIADSAYPRPKRSGISMLMASWQRLPRRRGDWYCRCGALNDHDGDRCVACQRIRVLRNPYR